MISDVALARAAFAESRNAADALLTTARADLELTNAPIEAVQTALKTEGPVDVAAAEQQVLDALNTAIRTPEPAAAHEVDRTA